MVFDVGRVMGQISESRKTKTPCQEFDKGKIKKKSMKSKYHFTSSQL